MIIAIDGPAAAGKSSVARALARELGLEFLNTGALYRGIALIVEERGVDPSDARACEAVARSIELDFDADGRLWIDGVDRMEQIRRPGIAKAASKVSAHRGVREAILPLQRALARRGPGVVVEGRDTGTVVFPRADHKFFVTASVAERALRRAREEKRSDLDVLEREIAERDEADTRREVAPLRRAPDAFELNTDGLSIEEVVRRLAARVRERAASRP